MKIAVTGSSGFVGKRLMAYKQTDFLLSEINLRGAVIKDFDFSGFDSILHMAGMAHQMEAVDENLYFKVNFELTRDLALHARASGIRQFVFLSTVKVYGEHSGKILNEKSSCHPEDPYGQSKLQAEEFLQTIVTPNFKVAIVRPPLIYGPEVKGNMIKLMNLASKPYPLPFGKIGNARSMVFVDNLIELVFAIVRNEASGIFLASDEKPLSTDELILQMRKHLQNSAPNFVIPELLRKLIQNFKPALHSRLFGSLIVDPTATNEKLNFKVPYSTNYGIKVMTDWYIKSLNNFGQHA